MQYLTVLKNDLLSPLPSLAPTLSKSYRLGVHIYHLSYIPGKCHIKTACRSNDWQKAKQYVVWTHKAQSVYCFTQFIHFQIYYAYWEKPKSLFPKLSEEKGYKNASYQNINLWGPIQGNTEGLFYIWKYNNHIIAQMHTARHSAHKDLL